MSHLPKEILYNIFDYLDDGKCRPTSCYDASAEPNNAALLATVCRSWTDLGEALLYRNLRLDYSSLKRTDALLQLLQSLHNVPQRYTYVRHLDITLPEGYADECVCEIADLLRKMTGFARQLKIFEEGAKYPSHRLVTVIALMRLERLEVFRRWGDPIFRQLLKWGDGNALKALKIQGYQLNDVDTMFWPTPTNYVLPEDRQFSSNLQTIEIVDCDFHAEALYELLRWPAQLKMFKIKGTPRKKRSKSYHAMSIQRLLDLHAQTLKIVELGCYYYGSPNVISGGLPNISSFPALRDLTIWDADLFIDSPGAAYSKLSGSALTHLTIDTGHKRFDCGSPRWLSEFARCRRNDSKLPGSLCVYIVMLYNENGTPYGLCPFSRKTQVLRLNRCLATISAVSTELDLILTWDKFYLSEAEWNQQVGQAHYGREKALRLDQYAEDKAREHMD